MCLQIEIAFSVPEETARIANAALPQGKSLHGDARSARNPLRR